MDENTYYGKKPSEWQININLLGIRDWWIKYKRKRQEKKNAKYEWVYKCG